MTGWASLSTVQRTHAQAIVTETQRRGLPKAAAIIAVATAVVESGLRNYANSNVPVSLRIPHDAVGSDHASLGLFQQQTGFGWASSAVTTMGSHDGWGPPATLMSPPAATGLFLARLTSFAWQSMPPGHAAQRVQGSAFPDRYQEQVAGAADIVAACWQTPPTPNLLEDIMALDRNSADYKAFMADVQKHAYIGCHQAVGEWQHGHELPSWFHAYIGAGHDPALIAKMSK